MDVGGIHVVFHLGISQVGLASIYPKEARNDTCRSLLSRRFSCIIYYL